MSQPHSVWPLPKRRGPAICRRLSLPILLQAAERTSHKTISPSTLGAHLLWGEGGKPLFWDFSNWGTKLTNLGLGELEGGLLVQEREEVKDSGAHRHLSAH